MEFKIIEIKNKEVWEDFLLECKEKTFLNSWNWGKFNKMTGNKIWRLGIYSSEQKAMSNEQLIATALVIKVEAKRGTFLFVPHGPAMKYEIGNRKYEVLRIFLDELKKIAKKENASFVRIAPILEKNEENTEFFKKLGFRETPIHMHPELTWELDIASSEDELLMKMRKTTRYLIRQAQKNRDIEIIQSTKIDDVEIFNKLYQETVGRHHFIPFSFDYLKNEFLTFSSDGQISIFLGKYKNEVISSAMIIFWQNMAFYHQGASSLKYSKIPVSYFLQWKAIKEAKRRGCRIYNFWGIAPTDDPKHPWRGLTLFKMGFGGYKKEYVKTQDFTLSKRYWLTYIFEKLRKIKRGL